MIDFATLQGVTIPEGVVTQIESGGVVLWKLNTGGGPIVLEVEKITSDTYAGETTYSNEQFVLLDIYPKTSSSTVNVTYGGLTKTLQFDGTNAQQVYFGTFNGVSDSVETPASGTMTIEGECSGFSISTYQKTSKSTGTGTCSCITAISDFGGISAVKNKAFYNCTGLTSVIIPASVKSIGNNAFTGCTGLKTVSIDNGLTTIDYAAFYNCTSVEYIYIPATVRSMYSNEMLSLQPFAGTNVKNPITVDEKNERYCIDGNCLIDKEGNSVFAGFVDSVLPSNVASIGAAAFYNCTGLTSVIIPESVTSVGTGAFNGCTGLTSVIIPESVTKLHNYAFSGCTGLTSVIIPASVKSIGNNAFTGCSGLTECFVLAETPPVLGGDSVFNSTTCAIIVPAGCGEAYKAADYWSEYADRIVEG